MEKHFFLLLLLQPLRKDNCSPDTQATTKHREKPIEGFCFSRSSMSVFSLSSTLLGRVLEA